MAMRARDAERSLVVEALSEAYVDGQLDAAEREQRVGSALRAVTVADLDRLLRDLRGTAVERARGSTWG